MRSIEGQNVDWTNKAIDKTVPEPLCRVGRYFRRFDNSNKTRKFQNRNLGRRDKKKKICREKLDDKSIDWKDRCLPLAPWCKSVCWGSARPPSPNNRDASYCPRKSCNRWCSVEDFSGTDSARVRCPLKHKLLIRLTSKPFASREVSSQLFRNEHNWITITNVDY